MFQCLFPSRSFRPSHRLRSSFHGSQHHCVMCIGLTHHRHTSIPGKQNKNVARRNQVPAMNSSNTKATPQLQEYCDRSDKCCQYTPLQSRNRCYPSLVTKDHTTTFSCKCNIRYESTKLCDLLLPGMQPSP